MYPSKLFFIGTIIFGQKYFSSTFYISSKLFFIIFYQIFLESFFIDFSSNSETQSIFQVKANKHIQVVHEHMQEFTQHIRIQANQP